MLRAHNLAIQYNKLLFANLSFTLGNKEKVGLIGLNGCGKSTLLKILAGEEKPDQGSVILEKETIGYLPQEYTFAGGLLVGEFLEDLVDDIHNEIHKVDKILNLLEFSDVDWYQEINSLSEGQKMKLYLTKVLIANPTALLLDEPTNHLDLYGILWLEEFIKNFDGICIIISHDRAFMNSVINNVFEIDEGKLTIFPGNYDDYIGLKERQLENRALEFKTQERKRQKFEDMIIKIKKQEAGEKQSKKLSSARARLQREVISKETAAYKEQRIKGLSLEAAAHKNKISLNIRNLSFAYSAERIIFDHADFQMFGKEKIWFYGANGIGKSTLLKIINEELTPQTGNATIGDNLRWVYFSQDQSHLNYDQTVAEYFLGNTKVDFHSSFGVLNKFLFPKELRDTKIKALSPGQRARLTFAVFAQNEYDFMILDEPTNHLDIRSKEVIEEALRNYQGSILLISHDRYFVENIGVDRSITIAEGKVV